MRTVTSKDGTTIAFDQSGKGPALILVGGALSNRTAGAPLAALLDRDFTVFTYDRRGRGDSSDTAPYAVQREVEDLEALITEAGGSASMYGMSSGAGLALEAAARGLAIRKLVLYEPPYIVDDSRPPLPADLPVQITKLLSAGRRGDVVERFMVDAVGVPVQLIPQMRADPMWQGLEAVAHTLPYDLAVMGDNSIPARRVASVKAPTLVVDGGASPDWLRNAAQALADALPNAQHRTLEGQTHGVSPAAIAPVLKEFFAE